MGFFSFLVSIIKAFLPSASPTPQPEAQNNEYYESLRAKAIKEGGEMAKCFQQSHEAYARREGALAKELSEKGKQHERTMASLNAEASAWIFRGTLSYRVSVSGLESDIYPQRTIWFVGYYTVMGLVGLLCLCNTNRIASQAN